MRISTSESWSNALNNLMSAQTRQQTANDQVATQKVATDLGAMAAPRRSSPRISHPCRAPMPIST
ncbi:MAG: hypothetical protein NVV72_04830 [Asticcacaulis sp.]|nr:hypothetical protein [Asticcacaulis sp.]